MSNNADINGPDMLAQQVPCPAAELSLTKPKERSDHFRVSHVQAFGDGPDVLLAAQTDMTLFRSTLTAERIPALASEYGYARVVIADAATTASFAAIADASHEVETIGGVEIPLAGLNGSIVVLARIPSAIPIIFRLASEADVNGALSLRKIQAICSANGRGLAIIIGTAGIAAAANGPAAVADLVRSLQPVAEKLTLSIPRGAVPRADALRLETTILAVANDLLVPVVALALVRGDPARGPAAATLMAKVGKLEQDPDGALMFPSREELQSLFFDMPNALANARWFASALAPAPAAVPATPPQWRERDGSQGPSFTALARSGLARIAADSRLSPRISRTVYDLRLETELAAIGRRQFEGYFRIVADMVSAARAMGVPVGPGRGSGAGSLTAFALGITGIDPLAHGLLFERFINPDRASLPDFDIDFCERRRHLVIGYLRERWGEDNVAGIATYSRLRAKQAVKDAARVAGLPYARAEALAAALPGDNSIPTPVAATGKLADLANSDVIAQILVDARSVHGLARSRSRHAGGIVIGSRPILESCGTFIDPATGEPATMLDKDGVEDAGLVKLDILGLSTLTIIDDAIRMSERSGAPINPWAAPHNNPTALALIDAGHGTGLFQLDSAGIQAAAKRMGVDRFEAVVALIALYRPGPMAHIETLAMRKRGLEPANPLHPDLQGLLAETYGVMIYQEQVMEAARLLAGMSAAQADDLRRAMSKKNPADMALQRAGFIDGFVGLGKGTADAASNVFDQIGRFAGYGFNKSHAAAYALIAYATACLKAERPEAFIAASLDARIGDPASVASLVGEARRIGVKMRSPDVTRPTSVFSLEGDDGRLVVRWPLTAVRGIGRTVAERLSSAGGCDPDLESFARMAFQTDVQLSPATLENLAGAGALDALYPSRDVAIARAADDWIRASSEAKKRGLNQGLLFANDVESNAKPGSFIGAEREPPDRFAAERRSLGINLNSHPTEGITCSYPTVPLNAAVVARSGQSAPVAAVVLVEAMKSLPGGKGVSLTISDASARVTMSASSGADDRGTAAPDSTAVMWFSVGSDGQVRISRISEVSKPAVVIRLVAGPDFDRKAVRDVLAGLPRGPGRLAIVNSDGDEIDTSPWGTLSDSPMVLEKLRSIIGVMSVAA